MMRAYTDAGSTSVTPLHFLLIALRPPKGRDNAQPNPYYFL
jgi:hypothetical protein